MPHPATGRRRARCRGRRAGRPGASSGPDVILTGPLSVGLVGLLAGSSAGGVPRYTAALARALDDVSREFPELRLSLLTTEAGAEAVGPTSIETLVPRLARRLGSGPLRLAAEQILARFEHADLLHFFDFSGPVFAPSRRFVTTVHDASVVRGGALTPARRAYKRRLQPWAAKRATSIVAVSAFARDEAVRYLGADPALVSVIHSGPGLLAAGTHGVEPTSDGPYLLYVGELAGHKNVPFLVRAFQHAGVDARLKLVGKPAAEADEAFETVRSSPARDRIEIVPHASDADVDRLYRGATALLHPARYEGFGFTPLEAMARGCPVLASDIPPLREISGDGALLLPLDEASWADGIRRVVGDPSLRAELKRRGSATAARYSWEETARAVCRLFLATGRGASRTGV